MRNAGRLLLPIGTTNYKKICDNYYYVDKTLMIKDILDEGTEISLFTRPRRFGKTLNMDMLRTFFEKQEEDTSRYFTDKKIWQQGEAYTKHQGKYPVIYLSLKDANKFTWPDLYARLIETIRDEFFRHSELNDSPKISNPEFYKKIIAGQATEAEYSISILRLSRMLREHYGQSVILIIDEYDTPIQAGYINGFYNEAIQFIRDLFSSALKDNDNLAFGFLTGILRVAKESIFSGLNNIYVYSVLDDKFSDYFGFTDMEVKQLAHYYALDDKLAEIKEWYDGYNFGAFDVYCPWDVMNYLRDWQYNPSAKPASYWKNTSDNAIIRSFIDYSGPSISKKLELLLSGGYIVQTIEEDLTYDYLHSSEDNLWSILYLTGYLTRVREIPASDGALALTIPNAEVKEIFRSTIQKWFKDSSQTWNRQAMFQALWAGDSETLTKEIGKLLRKTISYHDYKEDFYHAFLAGILASFHYSVESNREHGEGRSDIVVYDEKILVS